MTQLEKEKRLVANKKKYGLDAAFVRALKLPKTTSVKRKPVLTMEQILSEKSNFTVVEKLSHLEALKRALELKLLRIARKKLAKKVLKPLNEAVVVQAERDEEGSVFYTYVDTVACDHQKLN